jgi:prepilin-type N-terminal cleavage/methylation domain-containing protein
MEQPMMKFLKSACTNQKGFTSMELLLVIAIIGITAAISGPTYPQWSSKSQLREAATLIQSQLALARMTAMNRTTLAPVPPATDPNGLNQTTLTVQINWTGRRLGNLNTLNVVRVFAPE